MKEMVGGCCVCSDDRGWPENPLVYCDGQSCTVAVHQACYGIVTVPTGPWYCRKCESQERTARVKCELCPSKYGALKRSDNAGWAHVVCALYIPEVRFGNVTTMEPIQLHMIPPERFSKVCYICEEQNKPSNASIGACMQCNKSGCKQQFHVTCAQALGLLCEEAGNYLDNVKYCGYCQHHYSKLKKGGNVKTIPPYKPVSTENHQSDSSPSEKEVAQSPANFSNIKTPVQQGVLPNRRTKSSNTKTNSTNLTKSSSISKTATTSTPNQKPVNTSNTNNSKSDKDKLKTVKSAKTEDISAILNISAEPFASVETKSAKEIKAETDTVDTIKPEIIKEIKTGKKRKSNSRTPTPITVPIIDNTTVIPAANLSVIIPELSASVLSGIANNNSVEKRENIPVDSVVTEKISKIPVKLESVTPSSSSTAVSSPSPTPVVKSPPPLLSFFPTDQAIPTTVSVTPSTIIQTISAIPPVGSLVVSVPLLNTSLSPHTSIANQTSVLTSINSYHQEFGIHSLSNSPISTPPAVGTPNQPASGILSSDMSGDGGLKIVFEKQSGAYSSPELTVPAKRSRSMSGEKNEKSGRGKKRNSTGTQPNTLTRRTSRSQHVTPPPQSSNIIPVAQIKESPPSSPSSESAPPATRSVKAKGRKNAPASAASSSTSNPKDTKVFQNGLTAPHMLGNQLNPNSHMAQKMTDHLNSEIEAHSIYTAAEQPNLIGPQLHHRVIANVRSNSTGGSSTASGASGFSMLGGSGGTIPQTLDQLLERQWEQGSQFLMEQAQHFDIASLLSCLHQLRAENLRLEEHVSSLLQRRDHLLAVNARLAIPLTGQPATPQSSHAHTVNNIHPAVVPNHADVPRARHSSTYPHVQTPHHSIPPMENGLPSDSNHSYAHHRSPAGNQPQSNNSVFRHSPAGTTGYPSSGLVRQLVGESGGGGPRPQSYPLYQGSATHAPQPQVVVHGDLDFSQTTSTKPS